MPAMKKHQKVSLGAECVSDNSEKSCAKGLLDMPLQEPKKAWTDRNAEKGKIRKNASCCWHGPGMGNTWELSSPMRKCSRLMLSQH